MAGWTSRRRSSLVDALEADWHVIAPDWRGFGLSQWNGGDAYWFPITWRSGRYPARLFAGRSGAAGRYSMGGNEACLYAGVRPARVERLVALTPLGLPTTRRRTPRPAGKVVQSISNARRLPALPGPRRAGRPSAADNPAPRCRQGRVSRRAPGRAGRGGRHPPRWRSGPIAA